MNYEKMIFSVCAVTLALGVSISSMSGFAQANTRVYGTSRAMGGHGAIGQQSQVPHQSPLVESSQTIGPSFNQQDRSFSLEQQPIDAAPQNDYSTRTEIDVDQQDLVVQPENNYSPYTEQNREQVDLRSGGPGSDITLPWLSMPEQSGNLFNPQQQQSSLGGPGSDITPPWRSMPEQSGNLFNPQQQQSSLGGPGSDITPPWSSMPEQSGNLFNPQQQQSSFGGSQIRYDMGYGRTDVYVPTEFSNPNGTGWNTGAPDRMESSSENTEGWENSNNAVRLW